MPGADAWNQIPTALLDLGQKQDEAAAWAAGQRQQLADTWASVQRQAVQTMANTYQKGVDTLDHFQAGYQSAPEAPTGPTVPVGYNDMAGASSSPTPAFGSNPEDVTSPIDQARDSGQGTQLLGGDTPISGPINATGIPQAISNFQQGNLQQQNYAMTPTLGTRADQPAREQVTPTAPGKFDMRAGFTPSQQAAQQSSSANIALGSVSGLPEGAEKLAGATRFFHGTGSSFGVPDATHFDPNGLFGPGYYLTSDARVAGSYAEKGQTVGAQAALQAKADAIRAKGGPNADYMANTIESQIQKTAPQTRAVNVPNDLKLLDADAPMPKPQLQSIVKRLARNPDIQASIGRSNDTWFNQLAQTPVRDFDYTTLGALHRDLTATLPDIQQPLNKALSSMGYDGIKYNGGTRVPMLDPAGAPIEHTAVVIFPESMGKLTNAISGTRFGSPPAVGGAIVGGLTGYNSDPNASPQDKAKNAALGALALGTGAHLLGSGQLGRLATEETGAVGKIARVAKPGEERAGNILLRKYDPGVQDVISEAAGTNPNLMESARRGVVSDQEVADLATAAGTTVNKVIARWKPGDIENAETLRAMQTALDGKAREVIDAQKAIASGDNSTANQLRFQMAVKEHLAVQQAVSGVSAEMGRGLRVLRQTVQQALQSNDVGRMNALLKRLGGAEWTDELSAKLAQIDTSDPTQVHTFLRDIGKAKAPDYINEWLYNSILSSPSTHIANTVSNTVNALMGPVERVASAAVEVPLAWRQGRPRARFFGEAPANAYGLLQGLPEGVRAFGYAVRHGFSEMAAVKGEMPRPQAFKGPIGNAINVPSRFLTAADAMMEPILTRGAVNANIFRQAASEGLHGQDLKDRIAELTADVPAKIMEEAAKESQYRLYRQEPGKFGAWLAKGRDTVKIGPVEPLRFVLPFVQVPVNATKYGLERSPLGFLNPALWGKMGAIARKDPAAADMLARAAMGSMVTAAIGSQVQNGNLDITGAAPQDPAGRDAFYRQGKLPYALKIGGNWYSYQRWEPFNHSLTQVAAAVDAIRNAKEGADIPSIAGQAALTVGQNVLTQNFLTGISSLLNAATDAQRYGDSFVSQLETTMVPASAGMRAVANQIDSRQRAPKGFVENVENVIPGLSQRVPSRLNNYGEEQSLPGSPINPGAPLPLQPYKAQTANDSPLEMELARLKVEPGAAGKSIRGIDLTRDENIAYQRLSGGLVKAALSQLLNDPRYRSIDDTRKAAALTRVISHAKDLAATRYLGQLAASQGKDALIQRIAAKKRAALPKAG